MSAALGEPGLGRLEAQLFARGGRREGAEIRNFTAAARSVLLAGSGTEGGSERALVHIKSNLAAPGPALAYRMNPAFAWSGRSRLTAADLLAAAPGGEEASAEEEARLFLRTTLAGPAPLPV
jgi:hypothetical protein